MGEQANVVEQLVVIFFVGCEQVINRGGSATRAAERDHICLGMIPFKLHVLVEDTLLTADEDRGLELVVAEHGSSHEFQARLPLAS